MELLLLIIIIVVLVSVSKHGRARMIDRTSRNYHQGYFDGVRASENNLITSDKLLPPEQTDQLYLIGNAPPANPLTGPTSAPIVPNEEAGLQQSIEPPAEELAAVMATQPAPQPTIETPTATLSHHPRSRESDRRATANIALYVASLLVSAGVTLLTSVTGGDGLTVAAIIAFTVIYYSAGLILYAYVPLLRPVALAFVGTSLVLVPASVGALGLLLDWQPAVSALISSLFGFGMATAAAIYANSAALGYVMILAILSSGWSINALIGASPAWYYATIMLVGIACSAIAKSGLKLPLPIQAPTATLSPLLMPTALAITAFSAPVVTQAELTVIFTIATLYYAIGAQYAAGDKTRLYEIIAAKVLSIISAIMLVLLITQDGAYELLTGGLALIAASIAHGLWSLHIILNQRRPAQHHRITLLATNIGMTIGLLPIFVFTLTHVPNAALIGHIALFFSALIIAFSQGMIGHLLRQPHYYASVIISVIIGALSAGHIIGELAPQYLDSAPLVTIIVLLCAGIISLGVRQVTMPRIIRPLTQAYLYGGLGLWWVLSLIMTLLLSPSIMSLVQSISFFIYGLGFLYAAWREHFLAAITGAHISLTAWAFFLLTHFSASYDTAARISLWVGAGLLVLFAEVLYRYIAPSRKAATAITVASQAFIGIISLCIALSLTHPDIWLAMVAVSYYALWRLESEPFIIAGHVFLLATISSLLYHANLHGLENVVATGWAGLGLLGGLYMIAYRHSASLAANATLIAAVALPTAAAAAALPALSSLTACAAWGGATAASLLILYATRHPLVVALFTIPSAVILSYTVLATAGVEWRIVLVALAFGWFAVLCGGAVLLQIMRTPRPWAQALIGNAAFWAALFGTILGASSPNSTYILLSTALYLLSAGALIWEGVYSRLWWLFDVAGTLVLVGLLSLLDHYSYRFTEYAAIIRWHLWTIVPLSLGIVYWWLQGYGTSATIRLRIAFSILTFGGLLVAIGGTLLAQLLFITHHALIVVAGLITNKRLLSIWGAVGVTIATLWLLSSYAYLLYILIGIAIIIAVVYSIMRTEKRK